MSVLIKDMQLPDMCGHCRFATAFDCKATGNFIIDHSVRNADCPLIEVPEPHGDLIDMNAKIDVYDRYDDDIIRQKTVRGLINEYISGGYPSTVIPASEEAE